MNVTIQDVEKFSNQLLNIQKPPVLWSDIRTDGNCFFHAIDYAFTGKLLPKDSNKIILLRQKIAKTMNADKISGVSYKEFIGPTSPYVEIDVIIATAKYYKKTIIVISMNQYGGVTMIRPKHVKLDPLFLICHDMHYVPYHSKKVKISESLRNKLLQIEKNQISNGSIQDENGVYVTSFLLKDMNGIKNSLSLTRKRLHKRNTNSNTKKII